MAGKMVKVAGANCRPEKVKGPWKIGYSLDEHTVSSVPDGAGGFLTARTPLGQLVYDLKYNQKKTNATKIARILSDWVRRKYDLDYIDCIIGVPASTSRKFQPVPAIVKKMSQMLGLQNLSPKLRKTRATRSLKDVLDPEERKKELRDAFTFEPEGEVRGALLVDDLYRSGATASEISRTLRAAGVNKVYLITATKTRVIR